MRRQFVAQVTRAVRAAFGRLLAQLDDLVRQPVDQLLLLVDGCLLYTSDAAETPYV